MQTFRKTYGETMDVEGMYLAEIKAIGVILGVIISAITLAKLTKAHKHAQSFWRSTFGKTAYQVDQILHQLQPNTGTSLFDKIDRIEKLAHATHVEQYVDFMARKEALFQANSEGKYVDANTAYLRLVDKTFAELKGMGWVKLFPLEDRDTVLNEWSSALEAERDFDMTVEIEKQNGQKIKVHAQAFRKVDMQGETVGYMGRLDPIPN